jgi:hypothetical protein
MVTPTANRIKEYGYGALVGDAATKPAPAGSTTAPDSAPIFRQHEGHEMRLSY